MANTGTQKPAVTPYENYKGADPAAPIPLAILANNVTEYKTLAAELEAADGDKEKAVQVYFETSEDADAVKLRKAIEVATQKLRELAEKNAVVKTLSDEEKEATKKRLEELKVSIKAGQRAILDTAKMIDVDYEGVQKAVEEIGDPSRSNRGRKPGDSGSSTPRAYVIATVKGGNLSADGVTYDTFSKVATLLKCEVADLQTEFAKAAGVDPKDVAKVDQPVEFKFQPNENGAVYTISTKPKPRQKPGRKPKSETAQASNGENKAA